MVTRSARRRVILEIGLALYGGSFFLMAVGALGKGSPIPGYDCAWMALIMPWGGNLFGHQGLFENKLLDYLGVLLSGWINPTFLVAALFVFLRPSARTTRVLAIAVLAMIPFCWIVFYYEDMFPREGHVVWIAGMLLVLGEGLTAATRSASREIEIAAPLA
jgi:hypothetical protein